MSSCWGRDLEDNCVEDDDFGKSSCLNETHIDDFYVKKNPFNHEFH